MVTINVINCSKNNLDLPKYAKPGDAGMDLRADISEVIELRSLERVLIPTGLRIKLPEGYEAQVRPRSGLALKYGITVLNSPGTIDSQYTGEIGVVLVNLSKDLFKIQPGERVAQLVIAKYEVAEWNEVELLEVTERGEGGFGHTGK